MQQSNATPGGYCPFCGAAVGVAGARFCTACGRDMITGTPNAGQTPQPTPGAVVAPLSGTLPTPAMQATGAYVAAPVPGMPVAPVMIAQPPKSRGVAMLLEFLIAGAGSLYLNRVAQGLWWLFGSMGAGIAAGIGVGLIGYGAEQSYLNCYSIYGYACNDGSPVAVLAGWAVTAVLSVIWLIVRMSIVYKQASPTAQQERTMAAYPAYSVGTPGMGATGAQRVSAGRIIWIGLGLFGVILVAGFLSTYGFLRLYPIHLGIPVLFFMVPAYFFSLRRLESTPWTRVLAETLIWNSLAIFIYVGVFTLANFRYLGLELEYGGPGFWVIPTIEGLIVGLIVALLGVLFARWCAPWDAVRARSGVFGKSSSATDPDNIRYGAIVFGIAVVAMVVVFWLVGDRIASLLCTSVALIVLLVGSWFVARRLNALLAPAVSPSASAEGLPE